MIKRLQRFVGKERDRFETQHNNMFAFAFSQVSRYYRFLRVIRRRHRAASRKFVNNAKAMQKTLQTGTHPLTAKQLKLHDAAVDLTLNVELETEGFYLFAKVMLDKVARAIEFYFGPLHGCALDSHDDLVKRIERYAEAKGLKLPKRLKAIAKKLKEDVADFRDQKIAHEKSPRTMRGLSWDQKGNVKMVLNRIYPSEKDQQVETKGITELMDELDEYLGLVLQLIRDSRSKTALKLIPK